MVIVHSQLLGIFGILAMASIFATGAKAFPQPHQKNTASEWEAINALRNQDTILYQGRIYTLKTGSAADPLQFSADTDRKGTYSTQGRPVLLAEEEEGKISPQSAEFWIYAAICMGLVCLGGLMSGLTVGYFSIDELKLKLLTEGQQSPDPTMRGYAETVKPVLKNHHLLLVTLLLTNAAAMEALPIFLNFLVPEYLAIILSVTFVLAFGEVIPQAICTKNPLKIGAQCAWLTRGFICMTYPISYPIAKLLDLILGEEGQWNYFRRAELKALIGLHDPSRGGNLLIDEVTIMQGALDLKTKTVEDIMTPFHETFMVSMDRKLDVETMAEIMTSGHSRVPVYTGRRNNVEGLLLVKRLIVVDPDDRRPISQFIGYHLPIVITAKTNLLDALNLFQIGRSHMALVVESEREAKELVSCMKIRSKIVPGNVVIKGILTIEDVIEELISEDIVDETDIAFATQEYQQDMKGVRKAVAKFKGLLEKKKKRLLEKPTIHRALSGSSQDARRKKDMRGKMRKLVNEVRARAIVAKEAKSRGPSLVFQKPLIRPMDASELKTGSAPHRVDNNALKESNEFNLLGNHREQLESTIEVRMEEKNGKEDIRKPLLGN